MKMAVPMFTRFVNIQNTIKINMFGAVGYSLSVTQRSDVILKSYCTKIIDHNIDELLSADDKTLSGKGINKAMRIYLERARDYNQFIKKQIAEYDIGKRHLANMMGEDPDNFTQKDINKAIGYLFPSGLYDKKARPMMEHPIQLYGQRKEAEFDIDGRPYHFLYYTNKPNYYEALHKLVESINHLTKMENKKLALHIVNIPETKLDVNGTQWISQTELEDMLFESLKTAEVRTKIRFLILFCIPAGDHESSYKYFMTSMQRLIEHPLSKHAESFIMKYRKPLSNIIRKKKLPILQYDSDNRPFIVVDKLWRKNAKGKVKVTGNGSGKITINGQDITYFNDIQCREQVSSKKKLNNCSF